MYLCSGASVCISISNTYISVLGWFLVSKQTTGCLLATSIPASHQFRREIMINEYIQMPELLFHAKEIMLRVKIKAGSIYYSLKCFLMPSKLISR